MSAGRTTGSAPRVVVLGGTGFVGRHVCAAFRADGYEVVCAARRRPARSTPDRTVEWDLLRMPVAELAAAVAEQDCDVLVNAVGSIWGRTDEQMWTATAAPVLRLLDALSLLQRRPALIHLGSVLEYGPVEPGAVPGTAAPPVTVYGRAKLAATEAVLARARSGELDAAVLRIANVAGAGSPAVSLLGQVAAQLRTAGDGPAVVELSPLVARRDYVDVRDVAAAVVAAARVRPTGAVLDIGRGAAVRVRELVDLLVEVSGIDARIVERDAGGGPAVPDWIQVDIGPARERLGWRPVHTLRDAVQAFWTDVAATPAVRRAA